MTERDERVSTGMSGLDSVLDGLRIGDNVVWRVDSVDDYREFVQPFVRNAAGRQRCIIYVRFGRHAPLVEAGLHVREVRLDAFSGFEAFTSAVYRLITDHGRGAFYVFDCLSELLSAWATDSMVGNLFRVVCPRLYELDTVAYFALLTQRHSHRTIGHIRQTTQVLVDVRRAGGDRYLQPVKAWRRASPTMFLPHRQQGDRFEPIVDSSEASRLQAALHRHANDAARELDYWDRLFLEAAELASGAAEDGRRAEVLDRLCRVLIGRDERMLALARRYFELEDLVALRGRMIGSGYIGGKAVGMLLARRILMRTAAATWEARLDPHDSFFVGTDVYYAWLVHNGWWSRVMQQRGPQGDFAEARELRTGMLSGALPEEVRPALERMLDYFGQYPILVRSSSLLEDGFGNAFAGKYDSVFCVNQGDPEQRLAQLEQAICQVFASSISEDALVYRQQRGLADMEEPMALLLQRVNGRYHGRYYLPDAAGVGVSRNTFAWSPSMDPSAGMVRMVMGLGTRAVDRVEGDHACLIALDQPQRRAHRTLDEAARHSQHDVDVLDIADNRLRAVSLQQLAPLAPALPLRWCADQDHDAARRAGLPGRGAVWRIGFRSLLKDTPFASLMQQLLHALEAAYEYPVDVEFTLHLAVDGTPAINLVQCRPLQTLGLGQPVDLPATVADADLLFSTEGHFMGGSIDQPIARVIRVDPARYASLCNGRRHAVARLVGQFNRQHASAQDCPTLLIGPGRWGSSSPELGVPIRFADISRITVLVEVAEMGERAVPELSFGSHFFQDLVESAIAYVALFPARAHCRYRPEWLDAVSPPAPQAAVGDRFDAEVAAAVQVHDVQGHGLRVRADVRSQRLLCYRVEEPHTI